MSQFDALLDELEAEAGAKVIRFTPSAETPFADATIEWTSEGVNVYYGSDPYDSRFNVTEQYNAWVAENAEVKDPERLAQLKALRAALDAELTEKQVDEWLRNRLQIRVTRRVAEQFGLPL
jgi:hypothetical protein